MQYHIEITTKRWAYGGRSSTTTLLCIHLYVLCVYVQNSRGFLPVYWQTQGGLHPSVRPQPASSSAPLVLRSHALCRYCPPRR